MPFLEDSEGSDNGRMCAERNGKIAGVIGYACFGCIAEDNGDHTTNGGRGMKICFGIFCVHGRNSSVLDGTGSDNGLRDRRGNSGENERVMIWDRALSRKGNRGGSGNEAILGGHGSLHHERRRRRHRANVGDVVRGGHRLSALDMVLNGGDAGGERLATCPPCKAANVAKIEASKDCKRTTILVSLGASRALTPIAVKRGHPAVEIRESNEWFYSYRRKRKKYFEINDKYCPYRCLKGFIK
uniref:Uncharacterized protein n=1 Tax=Pristionchus pacificus TaxID=54126 RepID=A0A2A6CG64_PRIPA|eukprot:PDM77078.1 hypothetical protein PRIPAC_42473 [Pristionchus pacificus]